MKKKLGLMLFVSWLLLFSTTMAINENKKEKIYENVSQSDWESLGNNYWSKAICKEEKEVEVYSWEYRVIWDHFKNSNPKGGLSYYILDAKSMDSWNYILYNTSFDGYNNELVIWNSSVFQNRAWWSKIQPWEIVRHMTTAEEVGGTFKYWPWTLSSPVTDSLDNKKFQKANYRSDGSHPNKPTMSPNWDAEIRIMTLYDEDHNPGSSSDNKVIVECQKMVIRRCGDGILDKEHEECDPEVEPWKSDGTCDPDTCKKSPKCNSQYNWQTLDELPSKDKLCEVWVVTNLQEDAEWWRWSCSNEAGTDSTCYAKKPNNGDFIIKKTLISETKYITWVWQELVWEIKVTASGWNVKDMRIKDELPSVLDFVSYSSQLPSWVTIDEKQPTFSNDNKTIYWQTKWILKNGDSIVLVVVTKANAMPKATDNYDNVACASPEDNPEDEECDKKPIEWMPVIEKTLTWKKMVENTWEYLTWEVKVTASWWDISGFQIWDVMPNKLKLESAKLVGETRGVSIKKLDKTTASWAYHTVYYWDTEWTLRAWKTITMLVTTKVMEMPKANEDLLNVACVVKEGYVDCDEDQPEEWNPKLRIKKYILDGGKLVKHKNVKIWDKITYRINFGNSGDAVGTIVSIKDFLPKNVKYVSSEIFIVTGTNSSWEQVLPMILTGAAWAYEILDGVYIDIFGGITLQPGQQWYIILTGEILTGFQDQRTNFACIYDDEDLIACDDASHDLNKCEKLEVPAWNLSYGWGDKKVTCTTTSGEIAEYIEIDCGDGASWNRYITWSNIKSLEGTCSYPSNSSSSSKSYSLVCKVKIEGKEYTSNSCQWSVTVDGHTNGCFPAWTKVIMANWSEKNIEDVQVWDKVLSYNVDVNANEVNVVNQRIVHDELAHEMYELTINGNILKVTDVHPFYVRKSESSKDYDWIEAKNLKVWNVLLMSDGKLVKIEEINHYPNVETVYNLEVDGNHDYFVDKWYLVHNKWPTPTSCFVAWTKVTMADGSEKNIEDVKIWEKLLWSNGTVNTVLWYDRHILWNRHIWSINGWEYFVSDEHPFKTTEWWKSFVPEKTEEEIWWNIPELKIWDVLVTNHGLERIEKVASKSMDYYTPIYNFKLDGDHTYYANNYLVHNKGSGPSCKSAEVTSRWVKCTSSKSAYFKLKCDGDTYYSFDDNSSKKTDYTFEDCKNPSKAQCYVGDSASKNTERYTDDKCVIEPYCEEEDHKNDPECAFVGSPDCLNVNAWNFSIEIGEYLPFYFNVERDWDNKEDKAKYVIRNSESCTDWQVDLKSFKCRYSIKNPYGKEVYSQEDIPCLTEELNLTKDQELIKNWIKKQEEDYGIKVENDTTRRYWPNITYTSSKKWDINNIYWEYMFQLDVYEYDHCVDGNWETEEINYKDNEWICQSNFVLTTPYTVQKTPSGNLRASTDTLSKFKQVGWENVDWSEKTFANYLNAIATSEYHPNQKVNDAMEAFVKKYEKLAVSVNVKNSFLNWKSIKKVPWKNIYFISWDVTIIWNKDITNPFTIVQKSWNVTIDGNVGHNMMILTNWNIVFNWNCTSTQKVKWIFYAKWNLIRTWVNKNDNLKNSEWCTQWWLNVMWVLIWNNFKELMNKSRSHLETWFGPNGKTVKNIMNGGSVVIEYSPSIFTKSTMPPGAEDFTTALSIYKN